MQYTIKTAAEVLGLPATTIRYYDKQGLLPFMQRSESGYRLFDENDLMLLRTIDCLKRTGMSIKEIRAFTALLPAGDDSLQARYEMFLQRRAAVEQQMNELQETMDFVNHKCWYYETAIEAGTEAIHFQKQNSERLACEPESEDISSTQSLAKRKKGE